MFAFAREVPRRTRAQGAQQLQYWRTDLGHISGQPVKQALRHVNILSPAKNAMQSGTYQTRYWQIVFDVDERWINPLMGWASSYVLRAEPEPRWSGVG